jgi:hypothetical protein
MASDTRMDKQGDEFEPAPGIKAQPTRCWGFSAKELAKQFGMGVGLLLLNNQIGALTVQVENMPAIWTTKHVLHTFEIPMHGPVQVIVNIGRPTGRTGYGL